MGNPRGKPAVVLHGGPGPGATPWWTTFFDPSRFAVTLFDQRGCGRSSPHASEPDFDLSLVTTAHLIADVEALRGHHQVEEWLVFGGSWGSTLALTYAIAHPERVTELVLWGVTTTSRHDVDWLTWTMGEVYPEAFGDLLTLVPDARRGDNLPAAYNRLLMSPDAIQRDEAARAWCRWEDRLATLYGAPQASPRLEDPRFRLAFARLVTHFFAHSGFLTRDAIATGLDRIADIPAVFVRAGSTSLRGSGPSGVFRRPSRNAILR